MTELDWGPGSCPVNCLYGLRQIAKSACVGRVGGFRLLAGSLAAVRRVAVRLAAVRLVAVRLVAV